MCHLTRLVVNAVGFQPAALAGKAKLQHLELVGWGFAQAMLRFEQAGGAAGVAQMLSQLQQQTQLTHLNLEDMSDREVGSGDLPAAAYTALTASSKLQHLDISGSKLPAGVWQHLFRIGRQLLHLTSLNVRCVKQLPRGAALAPEGSRNVSCCPSLQ
jgi:hypothetical protein